MSEENPEIVRGLVDAWDRSDVEPLLATFAPDCEVIFPRTFPGRIPFTVRLS